MKKCVLILSSMLAFAFGIAQKQTSIVPGKLWLDNNGIPINAHGGGIVFYNKQYYWFGEHKGEGKDGYLAKVGVHVYVSKDLYNWKDEGIALSISNDTTSLLRKDCIVERPKVIYNKKNKVFVMWFHHELKGKGYSAALTGLAISKNVTGPYTYINSYNPNAAIWPFNFNDSLKFFSKEPDIQGIKFQSPEGQKMIQNGYFVRRDFEKGQMARDMTLFVDDDGTAYHIHSSEQNQTLHVAQLTDNYQAFSEKYTRVLIGKSCEAPAIFKKGSQYFLFSSGTTGWKPNPGRLAVANHPLGPWQALENPCVGDTNEMKTTFFSQSTHVLPIYGKKNAFIFMADRWVPDNLADSRYIWLPIHFKEGKPFIKWYDAWDLSVFNN